ncbi:MAG: alpha-isopropylmalate synthase regulatory domain-containing protein [Oscillospiraceae bacterium]
MGNHRNILLSEMSGRSAIAMKMNALDDSITRDSPQAVSFAEKLKEMEYHGYQFESAQASLELRMLKHLGRFSPYFTLLYFKVLGEQPAPRTDRSCSAMVKVKVGDSIEMTAAEGDGPVNALDIALRRALEVFFPALKYVRLVDYKVRVLDGAATAARVRVLIESTDGERSWTTVEFHRHYRSQLDGAGGFHRI